MAPQACDAGYCGSYDLKLWEPQFKAFRGQIGLAVSGTDLAGNPASADGGVAVTRWKWDYNTSSGQIVSSPAVGSNGVVYFGTNNNNNNGQFLAVLPQGRLGWSRNALLPIIASPTVGVGDGGTEIVYFGTSDSTNFTGTLYAVNGVDGGVVLSGCGTGDIQGSLVLAMTSVGTPVESAIAVVNASTNKIVALRPSGASGETCLYSLSTVSVPSVSPIGGLVSVGGDFYYGDYLGKLQAFIFSGGVWSSKSGWPIVLGNNLVAQTPAVYGTTLVTGGVAATGGVFGVDVTNVSLKWSLALNEAAWNPSVGDGGIVLIGSTDRKLRAIPVGGDGGMVLDVSSAGVISGAPVWGEGNLVYAADDSGHVQSWNASTLGLEWDLGDSSRPGAVQASVALDCSRDSLGQPVAGRPGVMYIGSKNGHLYSFITDSRGIDTSAPWPKYQHDPRNTGNAQTPLSQFACP